MNFLLSLKSKNRFFWNISFRPRSGKQSTTIEVINLLIIREKPRDLKCNALLDDIQMIQ